MTKYVGAVIFDDSTRLYLIYDSLLDAALRPLFPTEKAALDWQASGTRPFNEPQDADTSEEAVTIIPDASTAEGGEFCLAGSFASRASKKAMWLTGPRSFFEMIYENGATASRSF